LGVVGCDELHARMCVAKHTRARAHGLAGPPSGRGGGGGGSAERYPSTEHVRGRNIERRDELARHTSCAAGLQVLLQLLCSKDVKLTRDAGSREPFVVCFAS